MPNVELVKFETAVDKCCADWVLDIAKQIEVLSKSIQARTHTLAGAIEKLNVPKNLDENELSALPARINEILKENSKQLKGLVDMELRMKIDDKAKKVKVPGFGFSGKLAAL